MGQKDLTEKNFLLHQDIFADTLNALMYDGEEYLCAHDLMPAPTESFYHAVRGKLANQFSDAAMYEMKNGHMHVQYILENEIQAKPKTIFRKLGYEGALYRRQLESTEAYPVLSLLLYWGAEPWKQPVNLKEFFRKADLEPGTWQFITDVKLHVYEMAHLPKQIRNRFKSDMRIVVDYLVERQNYKPTEQKIVHPEALLLMLKALSGDIRYLKIRNAMSEEEREGNITMCELLDKYENRGIQKGIQQGEQRYAALNEKLIQSGRMDDLLKAAHSKRYRNQLYKELGIVTGAST
ncbi:MAG: Rpn family recombination-promoting nuclease/putative transposase [Acetatifactor sp.]|nr:Rpn family recombination-promoting nuclease/putative transposase [Acetatifactor sp.]